MLGWDVSMSEQKRLDFHARFLSLGIVVDLSQINVGVVVVDNKPGRLDKLDAEVQECLTNNILGFRQALHLLGAFRFGEGQSHCKVSAALTKMFTAWGHAGIDRPLTSEM